MLDVTKKKIREAQFFLNLLMAEEGLIMRKEPEARDFYLSAFLSASKSIGDAVMAEEGDKYSRWWNTRKQSLSVAEGELLKFTKLQREKSVHAHGAEVTTMTAQVSIFELQRELESRGGLLQFSRGGTPGAPGPIPLVDKTTQHFADRPGVSTSSVCSENLSLIARLIDEYENSPA